MRNQTIYEQRATRMYNRREEQRKKELEKNKRLQDEIHDRDNYISELKKGIEQLCRQLKYLVSNHSNHA